MAAPATCPVALRARIRRGLAAAAAHGRGAAKEGNTLPDEVAYTTLDARCEPEFARGFLLYQLNIRAAAFTSP